MKGHSHVVVFGRRGSGKTSLLTKVGANGKQASETIWIDADQYKKLTFPDTLIEIFRQSIMEFSRTIHRRFPLLQPGDDRRMAAQVVDVEEAQEIQKSVFRAS